MLSSLSLVIVSVSFARLCMGLDSINFGTFGALGTYFVANELGFFTSQGLDVNTIQIPNSTYGYQQLLAGTYDILSGTIDNAVGLRFNNGSDLTILGQIDSGSGYVGTGTNLSPSSSHLFNSKCHPNCVSTGILRYFGLRSELYDPLHSFASHPSCLSSSFDIDCHSVLTYVPPT